jgi:nuclear pore complex protein Nup98-Nup96
LTGHQITEACKKASEGGYFKLSTLISQAGGDDLFKQDIHSQLEIWRSEKLAPGSNNSLTSTQSGLVGRGVWRVYNLLAGLVGSDEERSRPEDDICAGLDWKRVFGLCLWYGASVDASVADVVKNYEGMILQNSRMASSDVARPIPKWAIEKRKREPQLPSSGPSRSSLFLSSSSTPSSEDLPEDPLYALIKLHADPALSLSKALNPLSFSPAGVDLGIVMCWHLYIVLSRVMRIRDFSDRRLLPPGRKNRKRPSGLVNGISRDGTVKEASSGDDHSADDDGDDENNTQPEGHSPTADLLTSTYALELESWGLLQEAVFVLLHLEGSVG